MKKAMEARMNGRRKWPTTCNARNEKERCEFFKNTPEHRCVRRAIFSIDPVGQFCTMHAGSIALAIVRSVSPDSIRQIPRPVFWSVASRSDADSGDEAGAAS